MTDPDRDLPEQIMWAGRFITAKTRGRWEYVSRARGIHAAVILAIDEAEAGRHVLLVDQYRVPLGRRCIELPAGLVGDEQEGEASAREERRHHHLHDRHAHDRSIELVPPVGPVRRTAQCE